MKTSELAESLGCTGRTILNAARRCLPEKAVLNGRVSEWTQEEAALILEEIKLHRPNGSHLESNVQGYSSPLTPAIKMKRAFDLANEAYEEELARLKAINDELRPKAEYHDRLIDAGHLTNFRQTAKELNLGERELIALLLAHKWIYRDAKGRLQPYAEKMNFFALKDWEANGKTGTQCFLTVRGKEKLIETFALWRQDNE